MPTPHTDQFEEIVKEFDGLVMSFLVQQLAWEKSKDSQVLQEMAEKRLFELKSFILSKLHHIRRETEKGMCREIQILHSREDVAQYCRVKLESDNSTQK